jgi:hypothetical protein
MTDIILFAMPVFQKSFQTGARKSNSILDWSDFGLRLRLSQATTEIIAMNAATEYRMGFSLIPQLVKLSKSKISGTIAILRAKLRISRWVLLMALLVGYNADIMA